MKSIPLISILILSLLIGCASEEEKATPAPSSAPITPEPKLETKSAAKEQKRGFNQIVTLKNGTILTGVKAVILKDSITVTTPEGVSTVYPKNEVAGMKKMAKVNKTEKETVKKESDNPPSFSAAAPSTTSPPPSGNWSDYQGGMSWDDAQQKCENLGMRLPTRNELIAAQKTGITDKWQNENNLTYSWYWTSEEYTATYAYFVDMAENSVYGTKKEGNYIYVRCLK